MAGIFTTLRDGLEVRLKTITGLEVLDHPGHSIAPVLATIHPTGRVRSTFAGGHTYSFDVEVRITGSVEQDAWQTLDSYLAPTGSESIEAAIDGDQTLGGAAEWAVVDTEAGIEIERDQPVPGGPWAYTATFPILVEADS